MNEITWQTRISNEGSIRTDVDMQDERSFDAARQKFAQEGVSELMLDALARGVESDDWTDSVQSFAEEKNRDVCFYWGPMRAFESVPAAKHLLLLRRFHDGAAIWQRLRSASDQICERMFGGGGYGDARDIEFYDIAAHDQGFLIGSEPSIAFFAPFYFDRWSPSQIRGDVRRSIMFVNSVVDRLRSLPCDRTNESLVFDGVIWDADLVAGEDLRRASCLWLGFHEYFHSAGPLPLFSADLDKLSLGKTYGFIEECRADMSGFVAMAEFASLFSGDQVVAQKCMLADRMTRSLFRTSLSDTSRRRAVSEVEVGRFWASTLIEGGALKIGRKQVRIDTNLAFPAILDRLQKIYSCEVQAAEQGPGDGHASLTEFATNARDSMLCSADDWSRMRTIFLGT